MISGIMSYISDLVQKLGIEHSSLLTWRLSETNPGSGGTNAIVPMSCTSAEDTMQLVEMKASGNTIHFVLPVPLSILPSLLSHDIFIISTYKHSDTAIYITKAQAYIDYTITTQVLQSLQHNINNLYNQRCHQTSRSSSNQLLLSRHTPTQPCPAMIAQC